MHHESRFPFLLFGRLCHFGTQQDQRDPQRIGDEKMCDLHPHRGEQKNVYRSRSCLQESQKHARRGRAAELAARLVCDSGPRAAKATRKHPSRAATIGCQTRRRTKMWADGDRSCRSPSERERAANSVSAKRGDRARYADHKKGHGCANKQRARDWRFRAHLSSSVCRGAGKPSRKRHRRRAGPSC